MPDTADTASHQFTSARTQSLIPFTTTTKRLHGLTSSIETEVLSLTSDTTSGANNRRREYSTGTSRSPGDHQPSSSRELSEVSLLLKELKDRKPNLFSKLLREQFRTLLLKLLKALIRFRRLNMNLC